MISTHIEAVKSRLVRELSVKIKINWLTDCVNYFIENEAGISHDELFRNTKEQLLLANYSHACDPVISMQLRNTETIWTFRENLFLQMQFIVDISEPYYEQWRRLHDIKLDEVQEVKESRAFQMKKKRCLKLTLTDGLYTITAMEHKPVTCLSTKLPPGVKVLIKGPVTVSNKIILLEPENVQIVGGEVEEMLIEYAYENVLLKQLKRPITAKPITNYVEIQPEVIIPSQTVRPQLSAPINIIRPVAMDINEEIQRLSVDDDDFDFDEIARIEAEELAKNNPPPAIVQPKPIAVSDDEEIPESVLRELEEQFTSHEPKNEVINQIPDLELEPQNIIEQRQPLRSAPQKPPINQQQLNKPLTNPWNLSKKSTSSTTTKKQTFLNFSSNPKPAKLQETKDTPPKKQSKISNFLVPDMSMYKNEHEDVEEMEVIQNDKRKSNEIVDSERPLKTVRLSSPPPKPKPSLTDDNYDYKIDFTYNFITIDQFVRLKTVDKVRRSYAIQAKVFKVLKFKIEKEWVMECQLQDKWSSEMLSVKFADEVVSFFAGSTAQEMALLNQKAKSQPQLKDDIKRILDKVNMALQNKPLLAVITAKVLPPIGFQIEITKILEVTDDNKQNIMLKIHDEDISELIV